MLGEGHILCPKTLLIGVFLLGRVIYGANLQLYFLPGQIKTTLGYICNTQLRLQHSVISWSEVVSWFSNLSNNSVMQKQLPLSLSPWYHTCGNETVQQLPGPQIHFLEKCTTAMYARLHTEIYCIYSELQKYWNRDTFGGFGSGLQHFRFEMIQWQWG